MNASQGRYIHLEPILNLDISALVKALISGEELVIPAVLKDSQVSITITGQLCGFQRVLKGDRNFRYVVISVDIDNISGMEVKELSSLEKIICLQIFHYIDKEGGKDCAYIYVSAD